MESSWGHLQANRKLVGKEQCSAGQGPSPTEGTAQAEKHREPACGREAMPASRACSVPSGHKWGEILLDMQRSPGTQRSPGDQEGGMGSRTAPAPPCKGQAPRLVTFLRVSGRRPRTLLPAAGTPPGHIWPHILKSELPSSRLPLGDTPHFRSCKTVLPFSAPPLSSQRGRGEASTPGATVHSRPHQRFSEEGPDGSTTGEGVRRAAEPVGGGGAASGRLPPTVRQMGVPRPPKSENHGLS